CLQHELDRDRCRQGTLALEPFAEVRTGEILHHDVRSAGLERADIDDPRDVFALEPDGIASLAQEPRKRVGIRDGLGQQELERDLLVERHVRRRDHHAHAAFAEYALDAVLARKDIPVVHWSGQQLPSYSLWIARGGGAA